MKFSNLLFVLFVVLVLGTGMFFISTDAEEVSYERTHTEAVRGDRTTDHDDHDHDIADIRNLEDRLESIDRSIRDLKYNVLY